MEKTSLKLQKWTKIDVLLNVITYVANVGILFLLFIGCIYINQVTGGNPASTILSEVVTLVEFIALVVVMVIIMFLYLFFEDRDFLRKAGNSEMLFLTMELGILFCFSYWSGNSFTMFMRPFAFTAVMVMFLSNRKTAIFIHFIFCILLSLFDVFSESLSGMEINAMQLTTFLIMGVTSGILATFIMFNVYSRIKLFLLSVLVSIPNMICSLVFGSNGETLFVLRNLAGGFLSGPLAVSVFILILPFFEAIFKRVSCFKFSELNDHKSKLLKRLITEAPGTFNHSIILSNIAEACATAIGEDALLAKTCAYYHDVGKLRHPEFFKENQADGSNPHDDLTPELSTSIIKSHTRDGHNLCIRNGLPKEIADVCLEHHGTMPILYFYDKAKKFTDSEVDIRKFCYEGPKPQTRIAAIIMIADGCEAAVRTLKDRSRESVKTMVNKIVSDRMRLGQFDECEITLKELNIIIQTAVNNLTGVYHSRIEYPKVNLENIDINEDM